MMNKQTWKRVALAGLLLMLLLGISGCLAKPDKVEELPTDAVDLLPFQTATPTPSPSPLPTGQPDWTGDAWDPNAPAPVITSAITATPTVQLITASPTPVVATITQAPAKATPTPTADNTLRNGSSGQAVKNLQQKLKDLGYYTGSVDGSFGAGTESALKEFQKANGLTADGIAGSRTLSTISSSSAKAKQSSGSAYATNRPVAKEFTPSGSGSYLQMGSSGSDVKRLQQRLKDLGYFKGSVNGNFGEDTEAALIAFQQRNGIWVDGVAGEQTQQELFSSAALPAASGSRSVPDSGYRTLQSGLSGEDVKLLQTRLAELGYYSENVDGEYGNTTVAAVSTFQQINGLTIDGIANATTQARLFGSSALYAPTMESTVQTASAETLQVGSMGESVYRLQERLYDLGYYTGRIDGIYSETVAEAVSAFQKDNKLTADGKAGKRAQSAIFSDSAKAKQGADDTFQTLQQGDTGERVKALQVLLTTYGYYTEAISGTYDINTSLAVQNLQGQNGLTADGVAGPATLQLLYQGAPVYASAGQAQTQETKVNYATLKSGATGPDVVVLQQFLQDFGYLDDDADGNYGASTLLAVQAFQDRNGLTADGVAGSETLALLYSGNALPSENFGIMAATGTVVEETPARETLRQDDEGQDVFTLQERLQLLGYLATEPDGKYGTSTVSAVKTFQERNGLQADGVAGKVTVDTMYSANAVPAGAALQQAQVVTLVDNRDRELQEQADTGSIQVSLAGGGVAAAYNANIYYTGKGGTLYRSGDGGDVQVFSSSARYIHATGKGITFVSGNKVMRVTSTGSRSEVLATGKDIRKLTMVGDTVVYQDGTTLMRVVGNGEAQTVVEKIADYTVDVADNIAYIASERGVSSIGLNGNAEQLIVSTPAQQVQLVSGMVFFRSAGSIYRIQGGVGILLMEANASWMGVYRDRLYYIVDSKVYRSDTAGNNIELYYDGPAADISFVSGKVYITAKKGAEVVAILPVD